MISGYTPNLSVQILISLLKQHNINKIVISPGNTDLEFTAGVQYDGNFQLYSTVDERSAAYMACGMAEESGEAIAIVCTESTASRNYLPGLTEAYYRKLPILAITGVHRYSRIGHLFPQIIDRSISPVDAIRFKAQLPIIKDKEDIYETEILVNKAILELTRNGGGPVHIDLPCCDNNYDFSAKELFVARKLQRYTSDDSLPSLPDGRIAIFVGSHLKFTEQEQETINEFCKRYDALIFCDHTSGIKGKYTCHAGIMALQPKEYRIFQNIDLLIHIGEGMADEPTVSKLKKAKQVWRVSPDGEIRDLFGKLTAVFQMKEVDFFAKYQDSRTTTISYLDLYQKEKEGIKIPYDELPLSNVYIASKISQEFPENSTVHLGVSNTIRAWTLFDFSETIESYSNVGCRGIDGGVSALIGASLIQKKKLHFGVYGDLTFFYDMNSLGNRDISNNVRILLINNGGGGVFKLSGAPGYHFFGDESTNEYIAAAGHYGNKSPVLVRNYVEALGFRYISASSKKEFDDNYNMFVSNEEFGKPVLFEVFTTDEDERNAFNIISSIETTMTSQVKDVAKQMLGEKGKRFVRNIIIKG